MRDEANSNSNIIVILELFKISNALLFKVFFYISLLLQRYHNTKLRLQQTRF